MFRQRERHLRFWKSRWTRTSLWEKKSGKLVAEMTLQANRFCMLVVSELFLSLQNRLEPEISPLFLGNIKKLENSCLESKKTFTPSSSINHFLTFNFQDCFEFSTWPWETKRMEVWIFESSLICFFSVRTCSWRILLRIMRSFVRAAMQLMQRKDRKRCHATAWNCWSHSGLFWSLCFGMDLWCYRCSLMAMGKQHISSKVTFDFPFAKVGYVSSYIIG